MPRIAISSKSLVVNKAALGGSRNDERTCQDGIPPSPSGFDALVEEDEEDHAAESRSCRCRCLEKRELRVMGASTRRVVVPEGREVAAEDSVDLLSPEDEEAPSKREVQVCDCRMVVLSVLVSLLIKAFLCAKTRGGVGEQSVARRKSS